MSGNELVRIHGINGNFRGQYKNGHKRTARKKALKEGIVVVARFP